MLIVCAYIIWTEFTMHMVDHIVIHDIMIDKITNANQSNQKFKILNNFSIFFLDIFGLIKFLV